MDTLVLNSHAQPLTFMPLSIVPWQDAVKLVFLDKAVVIKYHEHWQVRSQHLTINVPSILMMRRHVKWRRHVKYSKYNVYLRDNFTCQLQCTSRCKNRRGHTAIEDLTIDHVVPKSCGGSTSWDNVCTSCKDCNSEKGSNYSIVPAIPPHVPDYHELLHKRKSMPITIGDEEWNYYLNWPGDLVTVMPHAVQGANNNVFTG